MSFSDWLSGLAPILRRVSKSGEVAVGIERALWFLTAYREGATDTGDTAWLVREFRCLGTTEDVDTYVASIGELITGLIQISSTFLDGWARAQGADAATLMGMVRRLNDDGLGQWEG